VIFFQQGFPGFVSERQGSALFLGTAGGALPLLRGEEEWGE